MLLLETDNDVYHVQVIPLSQCSGLLEWCEGTVPIGDYLYVGHGAAHERYHPHDLTALHCRKGMLVRFLSMYVVAIIVFSVLLFLILGDFNYLFDFHHLIQLLDSNSAF